jgi:hypothetical protein
MAKKRAITGGWTSQQVMVAVIGGVAAVVVAVIGLVGVLANGGGRDDSKATPTPTVPMTPLKTVPVPEILIRETAFASLPSGEVEIRVSGRVRNFERQDRLYAIAKPTSSVSPTGWWVSQEVAPSLGGDWVAQIQAAAKPGQELAVSAVRIPAEAYAPRPGAVAPGPPLTESEIRASLQARGPDAPLVRNQSPPSIAAVPALPPPTPP